MTYVAMRGSVTANGVSRLHGDVKQLIVQMVLPRDRTAEVTSLGGQRDPVRCASGGTFDKRAPSPSAMVRCASTASRSFA
jgi:hypothetical protein